MAASIRTRPLLLKNLYVPRNPNGCTLCRQCQTSSASEVKSENVQGEVPGDVKPTPIPRGQIDIPKRKKRDSLSILKALASTVGKDPTGPKYQFMDDPKLIPVGRFQQKVALLSKASGRRTAKYIINEFRNTFNDEEAAAPYIPAFMPEITEYQHTDVSLECLEERISRREVNDAIEVYNRMTEEGVEVSPDTRLRFLELLCVFECTNPSPKLMPEEKVIDNLNMPDDVEPARISMDLADDVFQTLPEKSEEAYNWIVRGLSKVDNPKALLYYMEMMRSNIPVYVGTYNELIDHVKTKKKGKWQEIQKYLNNMKKGGVAPNLQTFHSVLRAMKSTEDEYLKEKVPAVLAEMRELEIEPTLQTWSLVISALQSVADESGKQSFRDGHGILTDIVDIIQDLRKNIDKIQTDHSKDNFFLRAMHECRKYRGSDVAMMLFNLKEDLGGRYIITSLLHEQRFYDMLLILISRTETPDIMMDVYSKVCPSQHIASTDCMKALLENLDLYREYQHVIQLWQDANLNLHRSANDPSLLFAFLKVFVNEHVPSKVGEDFLRVAKELYDERLLIKEEKMEDGRLFNHLISIFLKQRHLDYAWEAAMNFFSLGFEGYLSKNVLNNLLRLCIKEKDVHKVMSFCQLPEDVRKFSISPSILSENRTDLEELLNQSQLEEINSAFEFQE